MGWNVDINIHGNIYSFNRFTEYLLCAHSVLNTVGDGKNLVEDRYTNECNTKWNARAVMETGHDKVLGSISKADISGWEFMEAAARIGKLLLGAH